jgi:hypothetical protein
LSKLDVDEANHDLKKTSKQPAWVTEHLRLYRESGGAEGHLFEATIAGVPGLVPCLLLTTLGRRSGEKRTSPLFGRVPPACGLFPSLALWRRLLFGRVPPACGGVCSPRIRVPLTFAQQSGAHEETPRRWYAHSGRRERKSSCPLSLFLTTTVVSQAARRDSDSSTLSSISAKNNTLSRHRVVWALLGRLPFYMEAVTLFGPFCAATMVLADRCSVTAQLG